MRQILLALALFTSPLAAQDSVMVSVPRSSLTASQLASMESESIKSKAQAYGAWVGVGKEVGEAVNSSLSAISDNAAKFADTKVGKFSMAIVAWKVVGKDILGLLYTGILVFIGLPVLIWSYRRVTINKILKEEIVEDGKVVRRVYNPIDSYSQRDQGTYMFFHGLGAVGIVVCISIALFG